MSDADSAAVTPPENKPQSQPPPPPPKRWGDEEDDPVEESTVSSSGAELNVDGLKIDEEKKINKFLDDPEDSNIKAVRSLSLSLFLIRNFRFWGIRRTQFSILI